MIRLYRAQGCLLGRSKALVPRWYWSGNATSLSRGHLVVAGRLNTTAYSKSMMPLRSFHASKIVAVTTSSAVTQKCRLDSIIDNDISAVVNEILTFHEAIGDHGGRLRKQWEWNLQLERRCSGSYSNEDKADESLEIANESLEIAKYHALWNNVGIQGADSSIEEIILIEAKSNDNVAIDWSSTEQRLDDGSIHFGDSVGSSLEQLNRPTVVSEVQEVVEVLAEHALQPTSFDSCYQTEIMQQYNSRSDDKYVFFATNEDKITLNCEQARTEGVTQALHLLRTLSEEDWTAFDHPSNFERHAAEVKESDDPLGTEVEVTSSEAQSDSEFGDRADRFDSDEENDKDTFGILSDLLDAAKLGDEHLTTADYNFILARMAIATELLPDEILALMMQTHRQMADLSRSGFQECRPDQRTHEILLLALSRRFAAFQTAIDLVTSLSDASSFSWTPRTLDVTMQLCERKSLQGLARKVICDLQNDAAMEIDIPDRVYHSLINVLKTDDARRSVIEVLRLALKVK